VQRARHGAVDRDRAGGTAWECLEAYFREEWGPRRLWDMMERVKYCRLSTTRNKLVTTRAEREEGGVGFTYKDLCVEISAGHAFLFYSRAWEFVCD